MLSLVLLGSLFIAWLARKRSKSVRYGFRGHVQTKLWEHTSEYAGILAVVLLLYHVLLLFVNWGWQFVTIDKLVHLETFLSNFQAFVVGSLKLSWERTLLILLIVYILGLFRVRIVESGAVSKNVSRLRKGLRLVNKAAILLCAFTILGQDAGRPATTLQVRLRSTRREYGVLRSEIKDALSTRVGLAIDRRIFDRFPVAYRQMPVLVSRRDDANAKLRQLYGEFRSTYSVRDNSAEVVMRRDDARQSANTRAQGAVTDAPAAPADENAQPDTSYQRIETARDVVQEYNSRLRTQLGELAGSPAGRDILTHFHKLITSKLPLNIARLIAVAHPEIIPALEVLSETVDDSIKFKIEEAVNRLTKNAADGPADLARHIDASAERIGEAARINVTPRQTDAAINQARRLQAEVDSATQATAELKATTQRLEHDKFGRSTFVSARRGTVGGSGVPESEDIAILQKGLDSGWVVTRNTDSGKIFVHAESSGGMLRDLKYLIQESPDGERWTIHTPSQGSDGTSRYGRTVGEIAKPPEVSVGLCTCQ
jgi:hypothetical protein